VGGRLTITVSAFGNHAMLYKQLVYQHQGDYGLRSCWWVITRWPYCQ